MITIPYKDFIELFRGYAITKMSTNVETTKFEYYYSSNDHEMKLLLDKKSSTHSIRNKPGWDNGYYTKSNDYTVPKGNY